MPYISPIRVGGLSHISADSSLFMLLLPSRFPSNGLPESLQRSSNSLPTGRRPVDLTEFEKEIHLQER
jgi:hypothetical protein